MAATSKRNPAFTIIKLAAETDISCDDDSESRCSIQNCETDLVQDTPDTDTKSECSDFPPIEFELASSDELEPVHQHQSSGSDGDILTAGAIAAVLCDSSLGTLKTDIECDTDSSFGESEIKQISYWTCIQCKNSNNNPLFRYCRTCFQERKQTFPPRPRKRRLSKTLPVSQMASSSQDSGIASLTECNVGDRTRKMTAPNEVSYKRKNSSDDTEIPIQNKKLKLEDVLDNKGPLPETKEFCMCCNTVVKDGIFIHGKTAHLCFCYKCAVRTWKSTKRCPICNRRVSNVVKVFTS